MLKVQSPFAQKLSRIVSTRKIVEEAVFKLTPSNGCWAYTSLHDFTGNDGGLPMSNVVVDAHGNLYGTTCEGGAYGYGVLWEITP